MSTADRETVLDQLNLEKGESRKLVLLSFGGFAFPPTFLEGVRECGDYLFIWCGDSREDFASDNTITLPQFSDIPHHDLVNACDVVITKPGIGIVSECIANQTPIMYTSRDDFVEYDVLVEGLRTYAHSRFIPREDFLAGAWKPHLDSFVQEEYTWPPIRTDGADVAAAEILRRIPARRG